MIDFATGQLFDWFVSGNTAFPLIERLPSSVSGSAEHVGIDKMYTPLDAQGVKYSGIYPSLGPGELLRDKINSVVIAHGLFSLLDAFPFQHPDAPALNVSVPMQERLFGQGARARFANVVVTIEDKTVKDR